MVKSLAALWRTRKALIRNIERQQTAATMPLVERFADLTVEIAECEIAHDGDFGIKLALIRELAEHSPDRDVLVLLADSIEDAIDGKRAHAEHTRVCLSA